MACERQAALLVDRRTVSYGVRRRDYAATAAGRSVICVETRPRGCLRRNAVAYQHPHYLPIRRVGKTHVHLRGAGKIYRCSRAHYEG